jgi:hypothetical protein
LAKYFYSFFLKISKNREFVTDYFIFKMFSQNGESLPQKKSLAYSDALFVCSRCGGGAQGPGRD